VGEDDVEYIIRPFKWTLEAVEKYLQEFVRFNIFTDDVPHTSDGFLATMGGATLWFEMVKAETEENVAFLYLTDFIPSLTEKRFISATFHAVTWDAKAAPRRELVRRFLKEMFRRFKLHRIQAAVPLSRGGAIRTLHRLGFQDEGVMREPVRYGGSWYGVLLMSILENEV
jgi:RimJ/RimL family protein N-acetyltransferase